MIVLVAGGLFGAARAVRMVITELAVTQSSASSTNRVRLANDVRMHNGQIESRQWRASIPRAYPWTYGRVRSMGTGMGTDRSGKSTSPCGPAHCAIITGV